MIGVGKRIYEMTPEELREAGRKGGIASGKAKREKKAMRETLEVLLNNPPKMAHRSTQKKKCTKKAGII